MDSNYTKRDIQFMFGDYEGLPMPSSGAEPEFYTLIRSTPPEQLYELFVSTYNETGRLPVSTDPGVLQASIDVLTKVVVNRSTVDRARVRAGDMDAAMKAEVAAHNKKAEFDGWVWGHIAMHSQIPPHIPNYYFDRSRRDVLHALTAGGDAPGWARTQADAHHLRLQQVRAWKIDDPVEEAAGAAKKGPSVKFCIEYSRTLTQFYLNNIYGTQVNIPLCQSVLVLVRLFFYE
jgi:hypothetical protein